MNHLINILLISLFCVGWCRLLSPEMILENLGYIFELLPRWINKPLGLCVPCSGSLIGTIGYLFVMDKYNPFENFFYCICLVGVNPIIWFLTELLIIFKQVKLKELENLENNCSRNCKNKS